MIRPATKADLPRVAAIHADAWHAAYGDLVAAELLAAVTPESRLAVWSEWFEDAAYRLSVLVEDDAITGFIFIGPARDVCDPPEGFGELTHLYLDPAYIGGGYGHLLFAAALEQIRAAGCRGMLLWTLEGNARARRFYEAHGLVWDGARHDEPDWLGEGVFEVRYRLSFDTA